MMHRTIALFHSLWPTDGLQRPSGLSPQRQYRYAVWYKANPRAAAYMRTLQQERFPGAEWVDTREQPDWASKISQADSIVLLYPDSIGLGFGAIERSVFARKPGPTTVDVINGRRRVFRLDPSTRVGLRLRRLLEWSMLAEFLFVLVFVVVTPVLWVVDAVRGRT